jgi:hypothetical protein
MGSVEYTWLSNHKGKVINVQTEVGTDLEGTLINHDSDCIILDMGDSQVMVHLKYVEYIDDKVYE